MKKFNLFITSHSRKYLKSYINLKKKIEHEFKELRVHIIFSSKSTESDDFENDFYFMNTKDLSNHKDLYEDKEKLTESLERYSSKVPLDLYRSDLRGVQKTKTLEMLATEQLLITERIEKIFEKYPPNIVFVSSGTNILHSVAYYLSKFYKSKTYRVHSYLQGNINYAGQRVWFCSNNKMKLSNLPEDSFGYDQTILKKRVDQLHNALKERIYKPDKLSKQFISRRMPTTIQDFVRDVLKIIYYSLSKNYEMRLKRNLHLNRIKILFNSCRNYFIEVPIKKLTNRYFLFALNTPYDSQVLIRAPEYKDFISLINLLAGMMPFGYDLVLKEHPAFLGMLENSSLKSIIKKNKSVKLLSRQTSFPDAVKNCKGVIILNNTAFIESILAKKPVISLANGYFKGQGITEEVENLSEIRSIFQKIIEASEIEDKSEKLKEVMIKQFNETFPAPDVEEYNKIELIHSGIFTKMKKIIEIYGSFKKYIEK